LPGRLGKRANTDPIDAAVIAHFAEATGLTARPVADQAMQLLSDLVARRRQIVEMIGAERQREQRTTAPRLKKSIARLLKALEKELASLDSDINDAVRGSPVWHEKENLIQSVPGVGPIIARTLIAELPELGQLGRKEIAALAMARSCGGTSTPIALAARQSQLTGPRKSRLPSGTPR
jgi:transposase